MKTRTFTAGLAACVCLAAPAAAQGGIEARIRNKLDIPGATMRFFGKDLSESVQTIRVNDELTLKSTAGRRHTRWISLTHGAFFDETARNCTVTTFDEMAQQARRLQEQGGSVRVEEAGPHDDVDQENQYDVRISSKELGSEIVAGIKGTKAEIDIQVLEKGTENVVSTMTITQVYAPGTAYARIHDFDRKFAEQNVQPFGRLLGMDIEQMKAQIFSTPEISQAMGQFKKAGLGADNTVLRTTTVITSKKPVLQDASGKTASEPASDTAEVKAGLKKMFGKFRKNRKKSKPAAQSGEQTVTMRTEVLEIKDGVAVQLPGACVAAYEKKVK